MYTVSPLLNITLIRPLLWAIKEFWPLGLHNNCNIKVVNNTSAGEKWAAESQKRKWWGYIALQMDFNSSEKWAKKNLIKFNKCKWKYWTWGWMTPSPSTGSGVTDWKAALQKRTSDSWCTPTWPWARNVSLEQRRSTTSWAALSRALLADWRGWSLPCTQHWWADPPPVSVGSNYWPSSPRANTRKYWSKSCEGPQKWLRNWSICHT